MKQCAVCEKSIYSTQHTRKNLVMANIMAFPTNRLASRIIKISTESFMRFVKMRSREQQAGKRTSEERAAAVTTAPVLLARNGFLRHVVFGCVAAQRQENPSINPEQGAEQIAGCPCNLRECSPRTPPPKSSPCLFSYKRRGRNNSAYVPVAGACSCARMQVQYGYPK